MIAIRQVRPIQLCAYARHGLKHGLRDRLYTRPQCTFVLRQIVDNSHDMVHVLLSTLSFKARTLSEGTLYTYTT